MISANNIGKSNIGYPGMVMTQYQQQPRIQEPQFDTTQQMVLLNFNNTILSSGMPNYPPAPPLASGTTAVDDVVTTHYLQPDQQTKAPLPNTSDHNRTILGSETRYQVASESDRPSLRGYATTTSDCNMAKLFNSTNNDEQGTDEEGAVNDFLDVLLEEPFLIDKGYGHSSGATYAQALPQQSVVHTDISLNVQSQQQAPSQLQSQPEQYIVPSQRHFTSQPHSCSTQQVVSQQQSIPIQQNQVPEQHNRVSSGQRPQPAKEQSSQQQYLQEHLRQGKFTTECGVTEVLSG